MSYSLADKILAYLDENDVENAVVRDGLVVIPLKNGEMHRRIDGVVTQQKLASIVADYWAATKGELSMSNKPNPNDKTKPQTPRPQPVPQPKPGQPGV